jgi:CPA1 family monovalent cation:H+ antiporter
MIVGAAIGAIASKLTEFFDDHLLETTLTVLVAYGSYILAEQLRVSSVISVLVAGFVMGNFGSRRSMSATTRLAVDSFWEYAAFIAESLVFLLIGMQIKFPLVVKYLPFIGAGIVAILLARIVIVYALIPFASEKKLPIPFSWRHLLFWGGLRGSLCMAMALSLPSNFPEREMLVVTTFGVALFTLLVSGLSMEPLVKVLKVSGSRAPKATELLNEIVKLQVDKKNLQKAVKTSQLSKKEFRRKEKEIDAKLVETEQFLELLDSSENSDDVERLHIETALIKAQRDCIVQLSRKDLAKPEVLEVFRERIDSRFLELRSEMQDQEASLEKEIRPQ